MKRPPLAVPMPIMAAMATGGGMVTSMNAPPCRTADTVMGPKISPPGKPSRNRPSAVAVEAPTKSAKATGASAMVVGFAGSRTAPAMPVSASAAGTTTARMITRRVCTMAMPRISQSRPSSEASAITWASPPGMAAKIAVSRPQP